MAMTLIYCGGQKNQRIVDPYFDDIVWALKDLMPLIHHYAILDDPEHSNGNIYLQTRMVASKDQSRLGYILETRFCPVDSSGQDFVHYQIITEDEQLVLQHFKRYFMGESTDVRDWKDITEDFKKGMESE